MGIGKRFIMPSVINGIFAVCCHCIDVIIYSSKLGWSCRYISTHWLGNKSPAILSGLHYFFLVSNFLKWSLQEANSCLASKIPYIEWNLKVHFCIHKKLLPVPALSQLYPVSAVTVREFFVWSSLCTSCWVSVWLQVSCYCKYFPLHYLCQLFVICYKICQSCTYVGDCSLVLLFKFRSVPWVSVLPTYWLEV